MVLSHSSRGSVGFKTTEAAFASVVGSSTVETSTKESTTEISSSNISTDSIEAGTLGSSLTTLLTSFVNTIADTTTTTIESATTTAAPIASCPSDTEQCFSSMEIKCNIILGGVDGGVEVEDLNECVQQCSSNVNCAAFTYEESTGTCFKASSRCGIFAKADHDGWASGTKGTCRQDATSTAFTSTAEPTTSTAATSTSPEVDPICSSCICGARVQCNTNLNGQLIAGASQDLAECFSFCEQDDDCQVVTRRQGSGGCFKSIINPDGVTASPQERRYSAIKGTCY